MAEKVDRAETAIFIAYDDHVPKDPVHPEKNLMAAILWSVFDDLKKQGAPYREAREYVLSNDVEYIYSFRNVCLQLGLCHLTIRTLLGIKRMSDSQPSPSAPNPTINQ